MFEEKLFERIQMFDSDPLRRSVNARKLVIDSVILHLQQLLNTRRGNAPISEDYGVPDFLNFLQSHPESIREMEDKIKTAIDRYEPRLFGSSVSYLEDEDDTLSLRFKIAASLSLGEGRTVYLETIVDADGQVRIQQ